MEHPHSLLMLVLKQHYSNRPQILETAQKIIEDYKMEPNPNYEKTLGTLYQMMNDLPPDILLYFLTLVPLPAGPMSTTSTLVELMKQMHATNLLNNIRPTLLQYLNGELPPRLVPIQNNSGVNKNVDKPEIKDNETGEVKEIMDVENSSKVQSLIDENIKLEKANRCNKKKAKARPKVTKRKYQVKLLSLMCALNVLKNEKIVKKKYEDLRDAAFNTMNTKNITMEGLNKCRDVITDTTKKLKWLRMVKNVDVTTDIIKDEYGNSNVFHQNVKDPIPKTLLELNDDIKNSIDNYLDKC